MVWPRWSGTAGQQAGIGQIWTLAVVSLIRTWLMERTVGLTRLLASVVLKRNTTFRPVLVESIVVISSAALLAACRDYAYNSLVVIFRKRLTEKVHQNYFNEMNYYHISNLPGRKAIGDSHERLSREIMSVSTRLANLVSLLIKSLPPIVWFTFKLWRWQGIGYAMIPHLYLLLAYEIAQRLFPKNIGDLYRSKAVAESGFFQGASRIQTHSEAIAALGGSSREREILKEKFQKVEGATLSLHRGLSKFGLIFKLAYTYGCRGWLTSFMMLPLLNSMRAPESMATELSTMKHTWQVMIEMLVANGNLLTLHAQATHMVGISKRICAFIDTLDELNESAASTQATSMREGNTVKFDGCEVVTPAGNVLVRNLSFEIEQGRSLLLTGHNGAGKSSIFRVLGGLWATPTGVVTKPGASSTGLNGSIFYLPQKPYNVLGSLAANICYPADPSDPAVHLTRKRLTELLTIVNLDHLLDEYGFDSKPDDQLIRWEDRLSLGEQQRLAMARLFFHAPRFAILDECTSAVSNEMEELLYLTCNEMGITYITICHRPALRKWHDVNLHLLGDGKGGYLYTDIADSEPGHAGKLDLAARTCNITGPCPEVASAEKFTDRRSNPHKLIDGTNKKIPSRGLVSKMRQLLSIMVPGSLGKLGFLFGAIGLRTLCHEFYSFSVGSLYKSMVNRDVKTFAFYSAVNVFSDMCTAVVEESVIYLQNRLGVSWHKQLTEHLLAKLFQNRAFYRLRAIDKRIDDPDQRVTQEVQEATVEFSSIWGHAITPLVDIVWFTWRLHRLIGAQGMRMLFGFAFVSGLVRKILMPNHEALNSKEKELESTFRFIHTRLRNHAESVGFFGGDEAEHMIAARHFDHLVGHMFFVRAENAKLKFVETCISKDYDDPSNMLSVPDLVVFGLQAKHFARLDSSGVESNLASETFYVSSAAGRAISAFGKLTNVYEHLVKLLGSATRICQLLDVLDDMDSFIQNSSTHTDNSIEMVDVDIVTPNQVCLAKALTLQVTEGHSLMVTGPNYTGKTSLFRVLSGLWPLVSGQVAVPVNGVFLVPQRVYSVTGSIADQVTYPTYIPVVERTKFDEARMIAALERVDVAYLVEREGWDKTKRWEDTLSLGEQQRIGIARLFYHRPKFGVLDECTDAVSADVEVQLYTALHEIGITCVTISKRLALEEFHNNHLSLGLATEAGWKIENISKHKDDM